MNAALVWFCYKGNAEVAAASMRAARLAFPSALFSVQDDGFNPMDERQLVAVREASGATILYRQTDWARGGNLCGIDAVRGVIEGMREAAKIARADWAMKVDPDAAFFADPFSGAIEDMGGCRAAAFQVNGYKMTGTAYAIHAETLGELASVRSRVEAFHFSEEDRWFLNSAKLAEDAAICRLIEGRYGEDEIARVPSFPNAFGRFAFFQHGAAAKRPENKDAFAELYSRFDCVNFGDTAMPKKELAAAMADFCPRIARAREGIASFRAKRGETNQPNR